MDTFMCYAREITMDICAAAEDDSGVCSPMHCAPREEGVVQAAALDVFSCRRGPA